MLLGDGGKLAGLVAVADPIKPGAAEAIAKLHALGLKIVMATGDNATTAKAVAATARHRRSPRRPAPRGEART